MCIRDRPHLDYMKQLMVDMNWTSYCELKGKEEKHEEWRAANLEERQFNSFTLKNVNYILFPNVKFT